MDRLAAARAIDAFLIAIGRNPEEEAELRGTGARVADAYIDELCSGYRVDVDALVREATIVDGSGAAGTSQTRVDGSGAAGTSQTRVDGSGAAGTSQTMIVELRDVALTTTCPHHLMTSFGKATVAFAPSGRILGVGAIARLADAFARRLTLQETIGEGVVATLERNLAPRWVACRLEMSHACMVARGERTHGAKLVTLATRAIDEDARREAIAFMLAPHARAEGESSEPIENAPHARAEGESSEPIGKGQRA